MGRGAVGVKAEHPPPPPPWGEVACPKAVKDQEDRNPDFMSPKAGLFLLCV